MNPNYPTLCPPISNPIWFDVDSAFDEETEVNQLEAEYQDQVRIFSYATPFSIDSFNYFGSSMQLCAPSLIATHIQPLGKTGLENPDAPSLSDEDDGKEPGERSSQ